MKKAILTIVRIAITAVMFYIAMILVILVFGEPVDNAPAGGRFFLIKLASFGGCYVYYQICKFLYRTRLFPKFICDEITEALKSEEI